MLTARFSVTTRYQHQEGVSSQKVTFQVYSLGGTSDQAYPPTPLWTGRTLVKTLPSGNYTTVAHGNKKRISLDEMCEVKTRRIIEYED